MRDDMFTYTEACLVSKYIWVIRVYARIHETLINDVYFLLNFKKKTISSRISVLFIHKVNFITSGKDVTDYFFARAINRGRGTPPTPEEMVRVRREIIDNMAPSEPIRITPGFIPPVGFPIFECLVNDKWYSKQYYDIIFDIMLSNRAKFTI